jgi:hypothetical protein
VQAHLAEELVRKQARVRIQHAAALSSQEDSKANTLMK